MRKLRVLIMMDEALVPPASVEGMSAGDIAPFKTEHDVLTALRELGHEVEVVGVKTELAVLSDAIAAIRPNVCFNLVEDFNGIPSRDQHVVSYLELINQPYTGANPRGLTLARDKALTKKVLSYHGIRVPRFVTFPLGRPVRPTASLQFPLLVKSLTEEGSVGIAQASVVHTADELIERVTFLHEKHATDAIAEQYIEGRELYVGVLGNRKLQTLPIWELCLENLPADSARIATARVKWDESYRTRHGIISKAAIDLPVAVSRHISELAREAYRALDLTGYARIDLRLTPQGEVFLIEANPNPQIARNEDFADSAAAAGIDYPTLLQRILTLGMNYQPLGLAA
ncbi:MAG TPA: ATP-grasp domain-containing protein [Tepidisphaeraceae bacterium]|jgi:D-alanine-D-alanine ligase